MDVQTYLEQFDISRRKARILHTEYEEEMKIIQSIVSSPYYDQHYRDDEGLMMAKAKAEKLKDLEQNELKICDEVRAFIEQIPGIEGKLLYERYINCNTWDQIADMSFYSLRYVQKLHKQALEELQNVLDQNETIE